MSTKKRKPILPAALAKDTIKEVKGFVSALMYGRKTDTSEAILKHLFEEDPIIKGPFINLGLPFLKGQKSKWPLDKRLKQAFTPYLHQLKSWDRLVGNRPKHTLVTTGTGSGKSECFIMPILDYVLKCKERGQIKGVKALIIYPMNALIDDQGERLCELANRVNQVLPKEMQLRIGRYTGDHGKREEHDPENPKLIIDNRESLCENPPDVLLTNYRMLDFMLFRPEEQKFWGKETKDTFKYLVLDELHTFDGAQGADVACLIRRLRLKLEVPFTCIGTSATVASGATGDPNARNKGKEELCEFATTLFGYDIGLDAVIEEERINPNEYLQPNLKLLIPNKPCKSPVDLMLEGKEKYQSYLDQISDNWNAPKDPFERGAWIKKHPLLYKLATEDYLGLELQTVAKKLNIHNDLLYEFLDLLASAREGETNYPSPVMTLQVQLWVASSGYLLRKLDNKPEFIRSTLDNDPHDEFLPAVNCRSCGLSGWLAAKPEEDVKNFRDDKFKLELDRRKAIESFFSETAYILFPKNKSKEIGLGDAACYYDTENKVLVLGEPDISTDSIVTMRLGFMTHTSQQGFVKHKKKTTKKDRSRCPDCDTPLSLSLSTIGSSMLSSVLTGAFLAHGANPDDRKLLIFNDSTQDTAHQSGYLGSRGFRFNIRRLLWKILNELFSKNKVLNFHSLEKEVNARIEKLWAKSMKGETESKEQLMKIIPKDLWEVWKSKKSYNPLMSLNHSKELCERINWEFWIELGLRSDLGWSLAKTDLCHWTPKREIIEKWGNLASKLMIKHQLGNLKSPQSWAWSLINRLIKRGVIYHPTLESCYNANKFSLWPIRKETHLTSLFGPADSWPHILSLTTTSPQFGEKYRRANPILNIRSKNGQTWFELFTSKHIDTNENIETKRKNATRFLSAFFEAALTSNLGLKATRKGSMNEIALDPEILLINRDEYKSWECSDCQNIFKTPLWVKDTNIACPQYRCYGSMSTLDKNHVARRKEFTNYLARQYKRDIEAPFPHVHTGGMDGMDRRKVESAFKRELKPGDSLNDHGSGKPYYYDHPINVLCCTPTLEMGIDIGSLSGVMLNNFPATLANTLQRIGRSGRSSGNGFNTILVGTGAHDQFHWHNPQLIFKGSVNAPGCEFRTKEILLRQFHAFLLDSFVNKNSKLRLPNNDEQCLDSSFWKSFRKFLKKVKKESLCSQFLESIKLGDSTPKHINYDEIFEYLLRTFNTEGYWSNIEQVLIKQDFNRSRSQEISGEIQKLEDDPSSSNNLNEENELSSDKITLVSQQKALQLRYDKNTKPDYTFKLLADEGILPNYAFPEEGIQLTGSASVKTKSGNNSNHFKWVKVSRSKPSNPGLREFAPGNFFYEDSLKVPITRIERSEAQTPAPRHIICEECGSVSPYEKEDNFFESDCKICGAFDQKIKGIIDVHQVYGQGIFSDMQLRDTEEEREKGKIHLETFINFKNNHNSSPQNKHATWVSEQENIAFEFRVNAKINFLVRGRKSQNGYEYFKLCGDCGAIPWRVDSNGVGEFKQYNGFNRHFYKCQFFHHPNDPDCKLEEVAIGRNFHSDTIRFFVNYKDSLPTVKALLLLAVRVRLKGRPNHLNVQSTMIKSSSGGKQWVVTLYDGVPGGTGHLRALMPTLEDKISSTIHGLNPLKETFLKTRNFLLNCKCENGCYQCLYSKFNQSQHNEIFKSLAISWLGRFLDADDWTFARSELIREVISNPNFDSKLESDFFEGLLNLNSGISGVNDSKEIFNSNGPAVSLSGEKINSRSIIAHSSRKRIYIQGEYSRTYPDFTVYQGGREIAYIYTDGKNIHLNPHEKESTFFKTDVHTRPGLLKTKFGDIQGPAPVITYSISMVYSWIKWMKDRKDRSEKNKDTRFIEINGKPHHVLSISLMQIFNKNKIPSFPDLDQILDQLRSSFLCFSLGEILGNKEKPFLPDYDKQNLLKQLPSIIKSPSYGGLTYSFDGKSKFIMKDSERNRLDQNGQISEEFMISWEIFWILWFIDRDLVELEGIKSKNEHKNDFKPHGFQYLNKSEQEMIDKLLNAKINIENCLTTNEHLMEFTDTQPIAFTNGFLAIFNKNSMGEEQNQLPQKLEDNTHIYIVDPNNGNIGDLISSILNIVKQGA